MKELALHILDVLENAAEAGATRVSLVIEEDRKADRMVIRVADNGRGMDPETAGRVTDPFVTTRTTRHVGLGLPLFSEAARRTDGSLRVDSVAGQGTTVTATFGLSHIDRAPLGDVPSAIMSILLSDRKMDLEYRHTRDGAEFRFDSRELCEELGDVQLSDPRIGSWVLDYLREGEELQTCPN
jgi:hypothetical protein